MRVTNNTLSSSFIRNLNRNLEQMQKYQNQLSSGKLITKPSDDPMMISKIMDLKSSVGMNEQYSKDVSDAVGWVETQDGALNSVTNSLQRIRELSIYGSNGSLSDSDKIAIKDEVLQAIEGLKDSLNTNFDGRYIFGGQETKSPPFKVENGELLYLGDINNIDREIGKEVKITLLTSGNSVVGPEAGVTPGDNELGDVLNKIVKSLNGDEPTVNISDTYLGELDDKIENVLSLRSKIGAMDNRLRAAQSRNESEKLNLKALLSEKEDIDIAEKFMEYSVMSTVYQASLSVGSKILQPGLLDYLR